jgi:hypothetical protein
MGGGLELTVANNLLKLKIIAKKGKQEEATKKVEGG